MTTPTKQVSIRIAEPVWRAARVRALSEGHTLQQIVTTCLRDYAAGPKKGARSR
jgi:hypothetical protein